MKVTEFVLYIICINVQYCATKMYYFFLQKEVEKIIKVAWEIFQPFLFGLIGAEISVASLDPQTVGKSSTNNWAFIPIVLFRRKIIRFSC